MYRQIAVMLWRTHPTIGIKAIKLVMIPKILGATEVRLAMAMAAVTICSTNAMVNNCHELKMTNNPPNSGMAKMASNVPVIPFAKLDHFIFSRSFNSSIISYDSQAKKIQ